MSSCAAVTATTIHTGWTGSSPRPSHDAASISQPATTLRPPIGSQAVKAVRRSLARPAMTRPVVGRTTMNAEMPSTHNAMEKNSGASPRP